MIIMKANLMRLKKSVPFSERLNEFIVQWYEKRKKMFVFTDKDDFDGDDLEGTLKRHIERFRETGKIHVWNGASDNTIFGDATVNTYFRCWHDYIHITSGYGYDLFGETMTMEAQRSMLPSDWKFERELIYSEIVGQALYFQHYGYFLADQRQFTVAFLMNAHGALNTKFKSYEN